MLAAPPLRKPITGNRLGSIIDLIPLNGVDALLTLFLLLVFREPRPTNVATGRPRKRGSAPK
jgi:hypothetical protein